MEAVPEDYLKSVVFLTVDVVEDGIQKRKPKATGFLVVVLMEGTNDLRAHYVVTARHCIDVARRCGDKIYIRMNRKSGEFKDFPTKVDDWICHDNADVALIPFQSGFKFTDLDCVFYNSNDFVGGGPDYKHVLEIDSHEHELTPRVGHGVYFIGLFTESYGEKRNLPIARFGHISRMPSDLHINEGNIDTKIVAYLYMTQ